MRRGGRGIPISSLVVEMDLLLSRRLRLSNSCPSSPVPVGRLFDGALGGGTPVECCFVLLIPTPEEYRVPRVNPGVTASKLFPPLLPSLATPGPPLPYRPLQKSRYYYPRSRFSLGVGSSISGCLAVCPSPTRTRSVSSVCRVFIFKDTGPGGPGPASLRP